MPRPHHAQQWVICAECQTLAAFRDRRRRLYCSAQCSRRVHKRRQHERRPHGSKRKTYEGYRPILILDPCSYCGGQSATGDHIEPRARGGEDEWWNLTGVCTPCNSSKGMKPLLEFLLYRLD